MRRIFFTQKMATATISGHKRATTRDHQKALGEWEACTGSWRKPSSVKPFAIIDITSNAENTWQHTIDNFYAVGFDAIEDFLSCSFSNPNNSPIVEFLTKSPTKSSISFLLL